MHLYNHQAKIVNSNPTKTGLFLGCGGGKTRIALALARGKTLVVCPKTQRDDRNWEREAEKMGIAIDLTIISKEQFRKEWDELPYYDTVIFDEAETCLGVTPNTRQRNKKIIPKTSQLFEAALGYVEKWSPERLYLCTATVTRTPFCVWGAGRLLGKKWDFYKWREAFYVRLPMPGREVWVPKTGDEVKDRLARAVRSIGYVGRLEDWHDVPDQLFKNDYIELTAPQKKRLKEIVVEYPDPIVALTKRLQIENGILNGDQFSPSETFTNHKLTRILSYAEEFERLIIWAKFTNQIDLYERELTKHGYTVYRLDGQTANRDALFSVLKNSKKAILIAQAQIAAGWEWKECPAMIFASRTYSIADYEQAQGRIQRVDNIKKNIYINLIVKDSVDEAVHRSLENKKDFSERVYLKI